MSMPRSSFPIPHSALRAPHSSMPAVLTIAGSDSGGGAGIQADLKTFAALGVFGTSAITCITAQNPDAVNGVEAITPRMIALQIRTVCQGFPVAAAKTGMLYSAAVIRAVCRALETEAIPRLVVDPVMVATSGARLLRGDAVRALRRDLLPRATVITPNLLEAEILAGHRIASLKDLRAAARRIGESFGTACVAKGGHLEGGVVVDVLYDAGRISVYRAARVDARETHGTGCTFSAALTAFLARGCSLGEAVRRAKRFVTASLRRARRVGTHAPLGIG